MADHLKNIKFCWQAMLLFQHFSELTAPLTRDCRDAAAEGCAADLGRRTACARRDIFAHHHLKSSTAAGNQPLGQSPPGALLPCRCACGGPHCMPARMQFVPETPSAP